MQNLLTLAANPFNIEDAYVIVLGIGTVFVGLVCIIILCKILSVCCKLLAKNQLDEAKSPANSAPAAAPATKAAVPAVIPNRRETVAAIAAAIAEDLGADVSAIRIVSIEQL